MTALHRIRSAFLLVATSATFLEASFAGNVLVVDASGGGSFTTIQAAVDAAATGDTLLVKRGLYAAFTIDDKGLSVIADTGKLVRIDGRVRVLNLGPGRDVFLGGLNLRGATASGWINRGALHLEANLGSVRVEDCILEGFACGQGLCGSGHGIVAIDSPDVSLARCALRGGQGGYGGSGAVLRNSRAALYDTTAEAGSSSDDIPGNLCEPADGGGGAYVQSNSFLFASGSVFQGGDGGVGSQSSGGFGCACGLDSGSGGDGLILWSTAATFLLDIAAVGGQGAAANPGCQACCWQAGQDCCPGSDGIPISGQGAVTALSGPSRHLKIPNPQRELASAPIEIRGEPGDDVYLYLSRRTSFRFVPGYRGVQLTQQPGPPLHLGIVPSSGTLTRQFPLPDLGAGVQSRIYYFQAAHRDTQGVWTFGPPVSLVVLDQAF